MISTEWTIAAAMLAAPLLVLGALELIGYSKRRKARALAHRSKQRL